MQRRGSILTIAIVLTGVFLTMIVGTMAIYDSSNRRANSEKWRDVAEQAARSGLDLVLGWGQANIDATSKLPTVWEMNDGDVRDPIVAYLNSTGQSSANIYSNNLANAQPGQILGTENDNVGEYVMSRIGHHVVTIKARIQQYQISSEMPRQYRIGVIARVRKARGGVTVAPTTNERGAAGDLIVERMVLANVGKEPFSRYAALIDIDFVQNWVPGELVDGPVHINRGYVDDPAADNPQGTRPPNSQLRSLMMIHSNNSPKGFNAVNGRNFPQFSETVSMSAFSDAKLNDFSPSNHTRYIQYDEAPYTGQNAISIFTAPDNAAGLGAFAGPVRLPQNVEMPRSSRSRLNYALGMPPGTRINDPISYDWFNNIEDGVYIPTRRAWNTAGGTTATRFIPAAWNYNVTGNVDDSPAGGIYIRGNVEIMRMSVNGDVSYYLFQLGYGNFGGTWPGAAPTRLYIVAANRVSRQIDFFAFPMGYTLENFYAGGGNLPALLGTPVTTQNAAAFAVNAPGAAHVRLEPAPASAQFPFNGVIFVDLSAHDPARNPTSPTLLSPGETPLTGNIYALGDPGTPGNPNNKRALNGSTFERVATYAGSTDGGAAASKLTILTAGNVFIQNHVMLETIRLSGPAGNGFSPTQDNFQLAASRDLLGIVSDKQVVVGVCAPSSTTRQNVGTVVHAAIAALGDPGLLYTNPPRVDATEMVKPLSMRGSFTTEALMTAFPNPMPEEYNMLRRGPNPAVFVAPTGGTNYVPDNPAPGNGVMPQQWPDVPADPSIRYLTRTGAQGRFPGTPLAEAMGFTSAANNPNFTSTRGRLVVFGSVTQKKRGILGVGNRSFDKDIRYDKRLMSISPPLFPTSTNIVMRTSRPFAPNAQLYRETGVTRPATVPADDQSFMAYP